MRRRITVTALLTLVPVLGGAASTRLSELPLSAILVGDTILKSDLSVFRTSFLSGLIAAQKGPHLRLGLQEIRVGDAVFRIPNIPLSLGFTAKSQDVVSLEPLFPLILRRRVGGFEELRAVPDSSLPSARTALHGTESQEVTPRFQTEYADLAFNVTNRMELGGNWTRFQPCDEQFKVSCNANLVPQLNPDIRFGVQLDGTILDRIRVDVDFDQAREFDAANRINISYEGTEGDILQRLDVGDVTFGLPASRFLTEGIPAGNFGFQADGQLGGLDFQAVWAQQRGDLNSRVFQLTGLGDQRAYVQEDTLVLDDADYVRGQFFFLVDPQEIEDYPYVDALALDLSSVSPGTTPGIEPVQLYRFEDEPAFQQQVEGFIQADAVAEKDGERVVESGWFRYLQPGLDYFVHPSGLWIALRSSLRRDEMLAVTYVTALGDTVGDYNPERLHNVGGRPTLKLLKASGANHQPGRPTWDLEMHQVYRVSGSPDVERSSVALTVSLGELSAGRTFKRAPTGEDITFLRLFGLDEEAPTDVLDPSFVYSQGAEFFQDQPPVQGTFVVFPTLRPFAQPPPLPSLGLSAVETNQILADDANERIYTEEDPFERDNAGRFRLTLGYRLRSQGLISSFSLGAFGIRDGSERIFLGDRLLTQGVDYEIDYDVGQVRLLEAEQLFSASPEASVRATWEQRSLFQVSPTQVFGIRTHADLGGQGGVDLLGLYRSEKNFVNRPVLGTEPRAAFLGGVSGSYAREARWLDVLLDALPGLHFDQDSRVALNGEFAVSLPNPNTEDRAFLDDFDTGTGIPVSLLATNWSLGSAPTSRSRAEAVLPPSLNASNATPLVWQHSWILETSGGDSVGVHEGFFPRRDIDQKIRLAGSEVREPGMIVSFGSGPMSGPSWRSMTTSLSTNGLDLTKTEFVEFYASIAEPLTLVIDLGTMSEDAFFVDMLGNSSGTRGRDGEPWGLGLLDQEADPRKGEIWNDALDGGGVWGETCEGERGRIYRIGDVNAICTRSNGHQDTEDLDQDGNLDVQERHLRYVVRLDGTSPYLARTKTETGTDFQLYRIPIRGPGTGEVGGAFSEADLRSVRHLRITFSGSRTQRLRFARMRLVGSRWIKRAGEGVLSGIAGNTFAGFGRTEVATVSRVTEGDIYSSPPGVLEELVDPRSAFSGQGIEFNEKSLGIRFEDIPSGARAEVYQRFAQRPRNFLAYRQARLWVVPRRGDFAVDKPHFFFFKVGNDGENFYLFRTPLRPPQSSVGVAPSDWLPEVVIDFNEWFELRRRAEVTLLAVPRDPGAPPVTIWSTDSTYAVVLKNRGRAPNLASVREISIGVWNEGFIPISGEIWVDELRLGRAVRDGGLASSVELEVEGGDVFSTRVNLTTRGAFFRQLRDNPTYLTDRVVTVNSSMALDGWMPENWGIEFPVTFDFDHSSQAPRFLQNSDLRADKLQDLRGTNNRKGRVGISFRKRTKSANPIVGLLIDGLDARLAYSMTSGSSVTTEYDSDGVDAGLSWVREPQAREIPIVPGFAEGIVRTLLPGFLEEKLLSSRLRWNPERVSVGTSYTHVDSEMFRFQGIVEHPDDSLAIVTSAPREALQTAVDMRFRPLESFMANLTWMATRDVLSADQAVSDPRVQELLKAERTQAAGLDFGWETNRFLQTRVSFTPRIFSWLRNEVDWTTVYRSDRNASFLTQEVVGMDTTLALARNASGRRDWRADFGLIPRDLAVSWLGEASEGESSEVSQLRSIISAVRPLTLTYEDGIISRFNREPINPGLGYQFGFGETDDFRLISGDTAATLTDRSAWTMGSGVTIPGGFGLEAAYSLVEGVTLDTRSDRTTTQKVWPNLRAQLPPLSLPAVTGIRTINFSSGVVRTERETVFGGRGLQRRFDEDLQVPINVSIAWRGTLVTSYQGSFRNGHGSDPTGDTERGQHTHRISLSSRFLPPFGLARRLEQPVNFSFLANHTSERDCRTTAAKKECVPFLDLIRRSVNMSLDTNIRGFEFGVQISYDDRHSFVGQRTGSTQLRVMLFGQLQFSAGAIPFR